MFYTFSLVGLLFCFEVHIFHLHIVLNVLNAIQRFPNVKHSEK